MKYINQLDYTDVSYPTTLNPDEELKEPYPSFAKAGCGLACIGMMLNKIAQIDLSVPELVRDSVAWGANHNGTDMRILAKKVSEQYGISMRESEESEELAACLEKGGAAILHSGAVNRVFSDGGHFLLAIDICGNEIEILDPSYTADKYEREDRRGKVRVRYPSIFASLETVLEETANRNPHFYLFYGTNERRNSQ